MKIQFKTLTPLWTGGVETGIDETGIIGSLRWWYGAIVRGLGGDACDPTASRCMYDSSKANDGLCDACRLFGATGWQQGFGLQIVCHSLQPAWATGRALTVKPYRAIEQWYLSPGQIGSFTLQLDGEPEALSTVLALFRFLEKSGSLGAKPELGYGLYQIEKLENEPSTSHRWQAQNLPPSTPKGQAVGKYPDLRTFSFFKLRLMPQQANWWHNISGLRELMRRRAEQTILNQLAKQGMIPVTPALRNHLRFSPKWSSNAIPHEFFGTWRGNRRSRSKISLSWAYRTSDSSSRQAEWEIRGWCYLPSYIRPSSQKEIKRLLRKTLAQPQGWFKALGITPMRAQVTFAPTNNFLQTVSPLGIADFLNTQGARCHFSRQEEQP